MSIIPTNLNFYVSQYYKVTLLNKTRIFPDNRFVALDQFLKLLGFRSFEWDSLFKVFNKANCGFLEYRLGDITVEVNLGSGASIAQGENDWIRLVFRVSKDNVEKSAVYTFEMNELKKLTKRNKIRKAFVE